MENLNDDEDVNRTWENIKDNMQTSVKESLGLDEFKLNKPWLDEECLGFLYQRKRAIVMDTGSKPKHCRYSVQCKT